MTVDDYRAKLRSAEGHAKMGRYDLVGKRLAEAETILTSRLRNHAEVSSLRAELTAAKTAIAGYDSRQREVNRPR